MPSYDFLKKIDTKARTLSFSIEFFPPKTPEMEALLWKSIMELSLLRPDFVSVTYGAGGTTRARTYETLRRLCTETALSPAAHLTCVGASKKEIDTIIQEYLALGVRRIVALRGDPPGGIGAPYLPHPEGYQTSYDLVSGLKTQGAFDVSVAAYPERHPESTNWAVELDYLKRKVDAGADRAITQYFFDNDLFESYLERVRAAGITIPIIPGILPIHRFEQVVHFSRKCGASIPAWMLRHFDGLGSDTKLHHTVAVTLALHQILDLMDRGVRNVHFYSMNRADLVLAICHMIGIRG